MKDELASVREAGDQMKKALMQCENELNRNDLSPELLGETFRVRLAWDALTPPRNG